ncbi:UNVERIFIED_ORG: hypothetical protein J2Y81_003438 [Paraburkholderia sediminicola]|nr:hypothetical protein [Paraburkholderia sediminicola]
MRRRLIVWCLLTSAFVSAVLLLLPLKLAANHYLGGHPWPRWNELGLSVLLPLLCKLVLLAGLGSFFIVLANWIWPQKFPLRARFGRKDD